jgi:hypothetical protein
MRNIKTASIIISTLLSLLITISCEKEKYNQNPTISFIAPDNNLMIEHDTNLTIIVEPYDIDGEIRKVELLINDTVVKSFNSPPYEYNWHGAKLDNEGVHTIKAIAYNDKGATGESELSIEIKDFRTKYLGDFYFKVITESWMLGQPTTYDTSYYNGVIRRFELIDSENDLYIDDDSNENPNEKITIEFKQNTKITSILKEDGSLISKSGYHYYHQGGFTDIDTIIFTIGGLGGLGGGWNYDMVGIRE